MIAKSVRRREGYEGAQFLTAFSGVCARFMIFRTFASV